MIIGLGWAKATLRSLAVLAVLLHVDTSHALDDSDWARLQQKVKVAEPRGLPDLLQAFYRFNERWPTNTAEATAFETKTWGPESAVSWGRITRIVSMAPDADGNLVLAYTYRPEWADGQKLFDEVHQTDVMVLKKPEVSFSNLAETFQRWRTGPPNVRNDIANAILFQKLLEGETESDVIAILGQPARTRRPRKDNPQPDLKKILIYTLGRSLHTGIQSEIEVYIGKDGTCVAVLGKVY